MSVLTLSPGTTQRLPRAAPVPEVLLVLVTADWAAPARPAETVLRELVARSRGELMAASIDVSGESPVVELRCTSVGSHGIVVLEDAVLEVAPVPLEGSSEGSPGGTSVPPAPGEEPAAAPVRIGGSDEGVAVASSAALDVLRIEVLPTWLRCDREEDDVAEPALGAVPRWRIIEAITGAHPKHELMARLLRSEGFTD